MTNFNLYKNKFFLIVGLSIVLNSTSLYSQQEIIMNKDNTRPETTRQLSTTQVSSLLTTKHNGYNEIQWSALERDGSNKFFIEFSADGTSFQSAGQAISNTGVYNLKHYTADTRPLLYRVRIESPGGRTNYSNVIFQDGIDIPPVQIYTNTIKGNVVNARAQFPVERVNIVSSEGSPVFMKDINGARDFIPIAIPSLKKGIYFITFYGNNWKSTTRFFYES